MKNKTTTKALLGSDAYWPVNKRIMDLFDDAQPALLLSYLIDKEDYHRQRGELYEIDENDEQLEYFYATSETIKAKTKLGYKPQKRWIKALEEAKFIETKLLGVPAKLHFAIRHNLILQFVTTSFTQTAKLDLPYWQNIISITEYQEPNNQELKNQSESFDPQTDTQEDENTDTNTPPHTEKEKTSAKKEKEKARRVLAVELGSYLNELSGRAYQYNSKGRGSHNTDLVEGVLKKGYTEQDIRTMIEYKVWEWLGDPEMEVYLQPSTMFGGKHKKYIEEAILVRDNPEHRKAAINKRNARRNARKRKKASESTVTRQAAQDLADNF